MANENLETIPASKGDVVRLHDKLDSLSTNVTELRTTIALHPPKQRPCEELKSHLKDHNEFSKSWKDSFIGMATNFIFWLITIGLTALAAIYFQGPKK